MPHVTVLYVPPCCVTQCMSQLPVQDIIYCMRVYTGGLPLPCLRVHATKYYCVAKKITVLMLALYYIGYA
jgi:hypothetical protein